MTVVNLPLEHDGMALAGAPRENGDGQVGTLYAHAHTYVSGRLRRGEIGAKTARCQRYAINSFAADFGARPLTQLGPAAVERWLESRAHLKASSRRTQYAAVRGFTAWMVAQGIAATDPCLRVKAPKPPRTVPRAMPADAVGLLLAACPDARARAIVRLQVGLGLRCVEVSRLRIEDWERRDAVLRIVGKAGHERLVPMVPEVAAALSAYLGEHPATVGPLVRSYTHEGRGLHPTTISTMVSGWMRSAGVKVAPRDGVSAHALRHTAASDVLDACGDLRTVQAMLGHQSLQTTSIYLRRASVAGMREAMTGRAYDAA